MGILKLDMHKRAMTIITITTPRVLVETRSWFWFSCFILIIESVAVLSNFSQGTKLLVHEVVEFNG